MIPRPPLSVSLAGLESSDGAPWAGPPRTAIEWAARAGFRAVRLDAAVLRARDLDRSARRDLASLLRRLSLGCPGLDLWIPPSHFADGSRAERAVEAAAGAAELAGELRTLLGERGSPTVAVSLPAQGADGAIRRLADRAGSVGVMMADHGFPRGPMSSAMAGEPGAAVCIGIDPAAVLMGGGDPAVEALRAGSSLGAARFGDASALGRVAPGTGRLDELAYLVALQTSGYGGDVALDLRGLPDQDLAAREVLRNWVN